MEYTVQSGDNLSTIAIQQCGGKITWEQIAADNHIDDPHKLQIGQVLVLNCDEPSPTPVITPPVPPPSPTPVITPPVPAPAVGLHWGADSAGFANDGRFANVTGQYGGAPHFWGRYIGGNYRITADEAMFIHEQGEGTCRILLIYNGAGPVSVGSGYQAGVTDANRAIAAAQSLGVPTDRGIVIYADIEAGWAASPGWILGWWETMNASPYGNQGGFYCNPGSTFANPLGQALNAPSNHNPRTGQPFRPLIYSSEPSYSDCNAFDRSSFRPQIPACCTADEAVIWQYTANCGGFDLDMASEAGYATLWGK